MDAETAYATFDAATLAAEAAYQAAYEPEAAALAREVEALQAAMHERLAPHVAARDAALAKARADLDAVVAPPPPAGDMGEAVTGADALTVERSG